MGDLSPNVKTKIKTSKVLVVGTGGIGCELIKNLVLSGFLDIEIIDLDTIELSNLNRQFLFRIEHVGKPKALIARETAMQFNPDVKITAYNDSILATKFGVNFFKKFDLVLNALDNRTARNHVNRMCLNAECPLIESGTAGFNGQVELIKKKVTQCYECTPKSVQKTYPGCTIRNTPSEPIHCIIWAKHLYSQLFGASNEDEDISPDIADPELFNQELMNSGNNHINITGNVSRVNTRQWAKEKNYDPEALFNKFFGDDIKYLLSMSNLWKTRKPPKPIQWDNVVSQLNRTKGDVEFMSNYFTVWTLPECAAIFANCLRELRDRVNNLKEGENLTWDKDDDIDMDFVASCANTRAFIFDISRKTCFDMKSMAGNIIPAVISTNAITAGIAVLYAFRVLQNKFDECKSVYVRARQNPRQQMLVPEKKLTKPNPKCYVCGADPAITLRVNTHAMNIGKFRNDVLINTLNMVNPDVIVDAKSTVIISSEEDETECNYDKLLSAFDIVDGVLLKCDDFLQNYELRIIIEHMDTKYGEPLFEVMADKNQLQPKDNVIGRNGNCMNDEDGPSTSKKARNMEIKSDDYDNYDDDDVCIIENFNNDKQAADQMLTATQKLQMQSPITPNKRKTPAVDTLLDVDDDGLSKCKRTRMSSPLRLI